MQPIATPANRARRLTYAYELRRLTHYLFRYPAKFHPPVARQLVLDYTSEGQRILDPFCGSGTLLVEAAVAGREAIGVDIDPVAVFVSRVKTHRFRVPQLRRTAELVLKRLERYERPAKEYELRQFIQLATHKMREQLNGLWTPEIPNMDHWFRRYVIVDLARIYHTVLHVDVPASHRDFLRLCFASIIRACSNADPVPVSGLEVTSHMRCRDEQGRVINPFQLFRAAVAKALAAAEEYADYSHSAVEIKVLRGDATVLGERVRCQVDTVITSPPYHNAVDYYRRHTLEMYWLGLVSSHEDRLRLLPKYVGRARVRQDHPFIVEGTPLGANVAKWDSKIRQASRQRADSFRHYMVAMRLTFEQLSKVISSQGKVLFVVGKSRWNGAMLPTDQLFQELSADYFRLAEQLWYPVSNRYMSYGRRNGASIDKEHVLVFEPI